MAGAVVRHMLFSHFDKPGVPVPRAKLNEALLLSYKDHASRRKIPGVSPFLCSLEVCADIAGRGRAPWMVAHPLLAG